VTNQVVIGNFTEAKNGTALFAGLTVKINPNTPRYKLRFVSQNGLQVTRNLLVRPCQAGESTNLIAYGNRTILEYTCAACLSPTYSFYPSAPNCSQCSNLTRNGLDVCNTAAVVPAPGFYQSHPRSPLVGRG